MAKEIVSHMLKSSSGTTDSVLFNLLPYRPTTTGLTRYAERLLEAWPTATGGPSPLQLRLNDGGTAEISRGSIPTYSRCSRRVRWLQENALVQHTVNTRKLISEKKISVIYSPYTDYLFGIGSIAQIITCHDLNPLYFPSSRRAYWRSRLWLPQHLQRALKVIAISRSVADSLMDVGISSQSIVIIPNGIEKVKHPLSTAAGHDIVIIARHARNKNVAQALKGYSHFLRLEPSWPGQLVVIGKNGRETPRLKQLEKELSLRGHVRWHDHLDKTSLDAQMRRSYCLISASLMEGFDYPVFEAQALGLPTIASRIPVHMEFHQNTSILFDEKDDGYDLGKKLQNLVNDSSLWLELSKRGISNSSNYTLERQACEISELIASLAGR